MNESHSTSAIVKTLIDKGFLFTYELEVGRLNTSGEAHFDQIKPLSMSQQDAYNQILMQLMKKNVVLLHGVTSSGKTEVYIHLIKQALDEHKQVLYLLPEIALTVQIMERLHRVFGDRLGIYHSKYSDAERVEIWQKQMSGHPYDVILGARSAVFLPFQTWDSLSSTRSTRLLSSSKTQRLAIMPAVPPSCWQACMEPKRC